MQYFANICIDIIAHNFDIYQQIGFTLIIQVHKFSTFYKYTLIYKVNEAKIR